MNFSSVLCSILYDCKYPGSFILMKIQQVINETMTLMKPTHINRTLLSFGVDGLCV